MSDENDIQFSLFSSSSPSSCTNYKILNVSSSSFDLYAPSDFSMHSSDQMEVFAPSSTSSLLDVPSSNMPDIDTFNQYFPNSEGSHLCFSSDPESLMDAKQRLMSNILTLFESLRLQIESGEAPSLFVNERTIKYSVHPNFFVCYLRVLQIVHDLLKTSVYATKRDIYYRDVGVFKTQSMVDKIVDDLCSHLSVERFDLNILASTKGLVFGDFSVVLTTGCTIDFNADKLQGSIVPQMELVSAFKFHTIPRFILVVEKAAVFSHLLSVQLSTIFGSHIIVTGKGFPDFQTRHFLSELAYELPNVPIYSLMDGDPYGIHIHLTYTNCVKYPLKHMRYLGFKHNDVYDFNIHEDALLPLTLHDRKRGMRLLRVEDQQEFVKRNIQLMLRHGYKAEIQSLIMYDPLFLKHNYLIKKLLFI